MTTWCTIERPGYFGRHRDERYRDYDRQFGPGRWRLAWQIGEYTGDVAAACLLYAEAYAQFMAARPGIVARLVAEAANVYDDAPSNTASGLDFAVQETGRTHLQDIAIRQALVRQGRWFAGSGLIQIRDSSGDHPLSLTLSPGRVPFHQPGLIFSPELTGWWEPGSVESFYQSNKLLQVRN